MLNCSKNILDITACVGFKIVLKFFNYHYIAFLTFIICR